ncbi:response regulator [Chitinophaga oryziterrae]|uniref:Response regulator n=1 Tax=Chitinophaga oryziterrae TaxID=1031224 RepID=A0A6N8J4G4_9BACT|nr:LytTR family DNA-binding domain-containing protein [Chitinophaga oryziterrae]MVT39794.1 response regulator [Chitinophaga oryziterrae]
MIKAIAIDDEPPALQVLERYCSRTDLISLERVFTSTVEALRYLEKHVVDLLFLDIHMPAISGIDFYKSLSRKAMVIFTTAYSEYAVEGFNMKAADYLLKPFQYPRFLQAAMKAKHQFDLLQQSADTGLEGYLVVHSGYSLLQIALSDILFIEGLDDYLKIHLKRQQPVTARLTLDDILAQLPANHFVRIHRSYIVSLSKINRLQNRILTINGEEVIVGANYEQNFLKYYTQL